MNVEVASEVDDELEESGDSGSEFRNSSASGGAASGSEDESSEDDDADDDVDELLMVSGKQSVVAKVSHTVKPVIVSHLVNSLCEVTQAARPDPLLQVLLRRHPMTNISLSLKNKIATGRVRMWQDQW